MDGEMDIVGYMPSGEVRLTQSHWSHVGGQVMLLGVEVVRTHYDLGATDDHGSVHRLVSVESAPPVRVIGRKGVLSDLEEGLRSEAVFSFQACHGICSLFYYLLAVEAIQASIEAKTMLAM